MLGDRWSLLAPCPWQAGFWLTRPMTICKKVLMLKPTFGLCSYGTSMAGCSQGVQFQSHWWWLRSRHALQVSAMHKRHLKMPEIQLILVQSLVNACVARVANLAVHIIMWYLAISGEDLIYLCIIKFHFLCSCNSRQWQILLHAP